MRFARIIKGKADVRPVELMLPGHAEAIRIGQRPLTALEETEVLQRAREFAKSKGVDKPEETDPIYVMGIWAHTLAMACSSLEPEDNGGPMFTGADEILRELDRDRISYLFEHQQRIQEDHGCRKERMSPGEMLAAVHEIVQKDVGDPTLPFWNWGPSLRASFMHFLACLLWNSRSDRSPSGGTSGSAEPKASKTPSEKPDE